MTQADYYEILHVDRNATAAQIKEAYRHLAFKYHPDRNKENPSAVEQMKKINEAYAVLSHPAKKSEYDNLRGRFGASAYTHFRKNYSEQDIFSGSDINQIFEEMAKNFGFRGSSEIFREFYGKGFQQFLFKGPGFYSRGFVFRGPSQTGQQPRVQFPLSGNLGKAVRFMLKKIGGVELPEDGADIHENLYLDARQAQQGGPYAYYLRRRSKKLTVKIPPGIREGQRIRLAGMGEPGKAGGKPGDLFLTVHIRKPVLETIRAFFTKRKAKS